MKKPTLVIICLVVGICSFGLTACGSSESGFTVKGTLTKSGVDGSTAYLKLVAPGGGGDATALYFTASTTFSSGTATYSLPGVAAASYSGWAFIDVNSNASGDATSMPDAGDFVSNEGEVIPINADLTSNISETDWLLL
ncbi:MAG: hypothetical protein JRJ87_05120 [Deltaproteobacteria bacterium]|nr:hypothetical protein [Deltaproteobacteria bacterium]